MLISFPPKLRRTALTTRRRKAVKRSGLSGYPNEASKRESQIIIGANLLTNDRLPTARLHRPNRLTRMLQRWLQR
jgi:hypothetical protein